MFSLSPEAAAESRTSKLGCLGGQAKEQWQQRNFKLAIRSNILDEQLVEHCQEASCVDHGVSTSCLKPRLATYL